MPISNERVKSWEKQLVDRLDNEVTGDSLYKILWLVRHLEQYLERWLGFAQMENMTIAATLRNDLFYVILAAINVIEDRISQLGTTTPFPSDEWKHFRNALEWI